MDFMNRPKTIDLTKYPDINATVIQLGFMNPGSYMLITEEKKKRFGMTLTQKGNLNFV